MNLYYLHLGLDYNDYIQSDNDLRYEFQQYTNFIDDYFSKRLRKLKFKTDGTFNMLSISPTEFGVKSTSIVPDKVLKVYLPFDREQYEKIKGTEDCSYYLELIKKGFEKAKKFKSIPYESLLNILNDFEKDKFKNEWIHKKKQSKKLDLEIILTCEFTTNYFQLWFSANRISTKENLVKKVIIRTEVGNSIHEGMYKNLLFNEDIVITDKSNEPRVIINKQALFDGKLSFEINGDSEIKKMLSYEL